jgi:UTP--glucose-1-phosphate uridylyltransferase
VGTFEAQAAAEDKMRREGLAEPAIAAFRHAFGKLVAGESGLLPNRELTPVDDVPRATDLPEPPSAAIREALDRTVIVKVNGGLGTSMGLEGPKALLPVKGDLTFLDVVARQVLALRARHDARLPLVLMHSFATREASLRALERWPELPADVPLDFVQNREPKLRADDLYPVAWPANPRLEWAPPGHGDLYAALAASGMLATLLDAGYTHAFVSNVDNLGAVLEPRALAWIADHEVPFLMEVVAGTSADRKGGHIARLRDGRLVLRETAQVPPDDAESFRDFDRWRFYNTNNLWIDLRALRARLDGDGGVVDLPLIVNRKTVDPRDATSPEVLQLESAMGAALSAFPGARVLEVPRTRFAPVKTTDDLLAVRSDAYRLTDDARVELAVPQPPYVELDPKHFKRVGDFDARFPHGPPSLLRCSSFVVHGDVRFGRGVVARGDVEVRNDGPEQLEVPDGAILGEAHAGPGDEPARDRSREDGPAGAAR